MKKLLSISAIMLGSILAFATAPGQKSDPSLIKNSHPFEKLEIAEKMKTINEAGDASRGVKISVAVPLMSAAAAPEILLVVDLSVQDRITITGTTGLSSGTVSGSSFDGFYLKDLFSNAGSVQVPPNPGYSGTPTLTAASVATNNSPRMYRANTTDPGLNIWGYSAAGPSTFTAGQQAFTGRATWTVSTAVYNEMLTAPVAGGGVYFVADSVGMLGTATLLGRYSVIKPAPAQENLLVVDLSVQDRVTITATTGLSSGTVSGSSFDGFYLKDLFSNVAFVNVPVNPGFSGTPTLTPASVPTNNNPRMFRASGTDPGMNIYSYSAAGSTTFTTGQQAFTGTVTWTVSTAVYDAMRTAPVAGGEIYFVADSVGALGTATLIGKYSVVKPALAVADTKKDNNSVYPNPFTDVLNVSDAQNVKSVTVHDMSGRQVKTLTPSANLNLSQLKEGVYIVNLHMKDGKTQSFKVIKKQ